jgi:ribosomal protein L15E
MASSWPGLTGSTRPNARKEANSVHGQEICRALGKTGSEKPAPKKSRTTKLAPKSKAKAKAAAARAGRKYPNLVDNMNAAKEQQ